MPKIEIGKGKTDEQERAPWMRLDKESDIAFRAFEVYRMMTPPRSVERVSKELGKHSSHVRKWQQIHEWTKRVRAWDDEVQRTACEAELAVVVDMHKRHAQQTHQILEIIMEPARAYLRRVKTNPQMMLSLDDLSVRDLLKLIFESGRVYPNLSRTERLARGEATDVIKNEHSIDPKSVQNVTITVVGGRKTVRED